MSITDRLLLVMKMFKESYENYYSRACAERRYLSRPSLSQQQNEECLQVAKDKVSDIGLSRYQIVELFFKRYGIKVESEAVADAIELGRERGWLKWTPRRIDPSTGKEKNNAALTDKGLTYIKSQEFREHVSLTSLAYTLDSRRIGR